MQSIYSKILPYIKKSGRGNIFVTKDVLANVLFMPYKSINGIFYIESMFNEAILI